jgi:glycosyltransferase domain-containing protein
MKKDITFILTLKDRFEYTENWFKNNHFPSYNYLIADGSIGNKNELFFSKRNFSNIKYFNFGPDINVSKYLNKIYNSIRSADTKYVMLCDNDDYINEIGINECINVLDKESEFSCAGGTIFSVFEGSDKKHFNLPIPFLKNRDLHNIDQKFRAFEITRNEYKYLWYSVYRRDQLEKIWEKIISLKIEDLLLVEMVFNDLALFYGKYFDINRNHYVRLMNTSSSGASSFGEIYHKKVYFDKIYRGQLKKLNIFYSQLYSVNLSEIEEKQTLFYLWYFNNPPRVKVILFRKFHGLLVKFPIFSIRFCIRMLNLFYTIKNKLNV